MDLQNTQNHRSFYPNRLGLKAIGIVETGVIAPYWWLNERLDIQKAGNLGAYVGRIARLGQRPRVLAGMKNVLGPDGFARAGGNLLWNEYVRQVGRTMAECMRMSRMRREDLRALITLKGSSHLEKAIATHEETILFVSHTGNIGSMLIAFALGGFSITVARNPLPLRFIERRIAHTLQTLGIQSILLGTSAESNSPSARFPRGILTTFIDEAVNPEHTSWFEFGKAQFKTSMGPGLMAARKRACVLCVTSTRTDGFHNIVTIHPPLSICYTDDYRRDAHNVTQAGMTLLVNEVRHSPAEWLNWNYAQIRTAIAGSDDDPSTRPVQESYSERVHS